MLELNHIEKTFNRGTVNESQLFADFSLHVREGEFVSVVGSNGSGKTTMLNVIGGSISIDGGNVILGGTDITHMPEYARARRIGRVFQDPSRGTAPQLTVAENLALAKNKTKPYGFGFALKKTDDEFFRTLLSELGLGLEDKMQISVGMLSGGQRQALSLIMSTMTEIDLLLLDEHTAALDPKTAEIIMALTDRLVRENHLTTIMVTHNLRFAVEHGNRLLMMHKGNAVIDETGEEKEKIAVSDLLRTFNEISVECGN